eukprot:7405669-Ditylum_brightwellii.AAC.1
MIVRAVLRLKPSLGRMARTKSFIIWMHNVLVKDVASHMFLYRQYAFLEEIEELLSLCVTALLMSIFALIASLKLAAGLFFRPSWQIDSNGFFHFSHLGEVSLPKVISRCNGIPAVVAIVA